MEIIYIIGVVQSLFFIILIASKKTRSWADLYLIAFFLIMMLSLLFAYSNVFEFYMDYPEIMPFVVLVPLLYGPSLYFYVSALESNPAQSIRFSIHLVPIILFYFVMSPLYFERELLLKSFTDRFIDLPLYVNFGAAILYLSAPIYFILILIKLKKHKRQIKNAFSYNEKINLNWLNYLVSGAIIVWIPEIGRSVYINYFSHSNIYAYSHIIKISFVVFVFLMGFYGLRQGNIFTEQETYPESAENQFGQDLKNQPSKSKKNPVPMNKLPALSKQLLRYLETEKPYLDSNLKLVDVSSALNLTAHSLSFVINEHLKKNFFNLINGYRVSQAEQKLQQPDSSNFTILSIAFDCGFNSKSAFNRIFKEQTGQTPSQYQKSFRSPTVKKQKT
mgnify:CR=1 FL=1